MVSPPPNPNPHPNPQRPTSATDVIKTGLVKRPGEKICCLHKKHIVSFIYVYENPAARSDRCNGAPRKKLAKSFIHKIPTCDYCSNYRARQPQLVHCFSSVSLLINECLVITGFMRRRVKTLAGPHSTLLSAAVKASTPASSTASPRLQLLSCARAQVRRK